MTVTAGLRPLIEVWHGDPTWAEALRCGAVAITGPEALRRRVPAWFTLPPFAAVPRAGRE
ncbi:hypothetical protein [Embleya sp. NPDC001921]